MDQAVAQIFTMVNDYHQDRQPRLVATVNVDFLVNTLSWFSTRPRHPELLNILRQANLVTADGMPIVWISRLLKTPLKERVTGADLVPKLAREASLKGKSIYFLGGMGDAGQRAAEILKSACPDLIVAGAEAPFVKTVGNELADARDQDLQIVDRINHSRADILLVAFGNPKQEVWFERNRAYLQVPVTIGIGGTFEFITGSVARAPLWMQKTGLEWIFRITQDPKRLIKRYVIGFFKFGLMVLPVVIYDSYRRFVYKRLNRGNSNTNAKLDLSTAAAIQLISVEDPLDAVMVEKLKADLGVPTVLGHTAIVDLSLVNFVDSSGIGFLLRLWNENKKNKGRLYFIGIQKAVARTLKISRIYDLFSGHMAETVKDAVALLAEGDEAPDFHMVFTQTESCLLIRLFGTLDAYQASYIDMDDMIEKLERRHCALDLSGLSFIDSSGLMIFLKIYRQVTSQGRNCWVGGASATVRQMFKITKTDRLMKMVPDVHEIVRSLENN